MTHYFRPIIDRWATPAEFARAVGCPVKNVREWIRVDSIPAPWFSAVTRAAVAGGWNDVTADHLAALAEQRRIKRQRSANAEAA